ncbi:MAG: 2-amino-4-hydroxy-6-hydroxymethyldihydropteridine diphosphokinase [Bacteroidetes bacterium HGW-Bacteroidetes-2]|jgi:2-amino-4-hydroxy-6-hydroxymethyldihydropteridine diphosphokinase|nr:MAG: 2-amino-4-hydroxy-6-hydroxymethyldihydropteridine diphosphokinase [Bacteroidetes bacterium HGW-Bacteroidetes-2]
MNTLHETYIALGSNLGDKFLNLQLAVRAIFEDIGSVSKISPVYETASWGFESENFLNAVLLVKTSFTPQEVLKALLEIEKKIGRTRTSEVGYQPRIIDLDILFYDEQIIDSQTLQIPHPQLQNRRFVLQPLTDIAPNVFHAKLKKTSEILLQQCSDIIPAEKLPRWLKNPLSEYNLAAFNFIAIEGNIGAGKTTLASKIAADFNAKLVLERFADNPFLPKFYEDKSRFAFPLEMSFLADRYQQVHDDLGQLDLFKDFIVADYDIYKSLIFSKVTLQEEEYKLYRRLFELMYKDTKRPELYIFLFQSTEKLLENIKKRGRIYEQSISAQYLESIQKAYLDFIKTNSKNKIKIIDITNKDFLENRKEYLEILRQISQN